MKYLLILFTTLLMQACTSAEIYDKYNQNKSFRKSYSSPIKVNMLNHKTSPFYFLVSNNSSSDNYKLTVRWVNTYNNGSLLSSNSTLKFLINNEYIMTFKPINRVKFAAYNLEEHANEEEVSFSLTRAEIAQLARAKKARIELTGNNGIIAFASFKKSHTANSFAKLLEHSYYNNQPNIMKTMIE